MDAAASAWLGRPCVAVPSVRVGLCWALESLGFARHRDHVLIPRFVGRCIVNAIGRAAWPVEAATPETRAAILVDQFGLRQDTRALAAEFDRRGWSYLEDSPYGVGEDEAPGPGSLGRFIGLGKVLPVVQGALFVAGRESVADALRRRRDVHTAWTWPVWTTMMILRRRRRTTAYSAAADAAYEMYVPAGGGQGWLRGNMRKAAANADRFAHEARARLDAATAALGARAVRPDLTRLPYVLPIVAEPDADRLAAAFTRHGFDAAVLHLDAARNVLTPKFVRVLLLPLHARIPRASFDALVADLEGMVAACA